METLQSEDSQQYNNWSSSHNFCVCSFSTLIKIQTNSSEYNERIFIHYSGMYLYSFSLTIDQAVHSQKTELKRFGSK